MGGGRHKGEIKQRVEGEEGERDRELRTQNSELYYSRIKILGICLFLQSVLANLHANTYETTLSTLTTMIQ